MRGRSLGVWIALALAPLTAYPADSCKLEKYAELPVTMLGTRPLVAGAINGVDALFLADSGAFFSSLSQEITARLKLRLSDLPHGLRVRGVGGVADARATTVKEFSLQGLGTRPLHNVDFIVVGHSFASGSAGIVGQNVLGRADTEYDLANGYIRLFRAKDCRDRLLAYWHGTTAVAVVKMEYTTALSPHIIGTATLNGARIRVVFDTGAARSILTRRTAARAGIKPDGPGVTAAGLWSGIGPQAIETWIANFATLDLGGEEIKNARLRLGDVELADGADMLLGADFFLSHRLYVAASQHEVYFTYNGGSVFDLSVTNAVKSAAAQPEGAQSASTQPAGALPADEPAAGTDAGPMPDAPSDAAGFRRRGSALAGRRDSRGAIADYDAAIKLDSADPDNYYLRGLARWQARQPVLAMDDFDQALKLNPDDVPVLLERGTLRLAGKDETGAHADFDKVAGLAPNDPSLGLRIAAIYIEAGHFDAAITRLDRWIDVNRRDDRLPEALHERCRARAVMGKELDLALTDCNASLRRGQRTSHVLNSRALVWLRLGQFDKSIADYRASLGLQPKNAGARYGLGLAELKKGLQAAGDQDIRGALELAPNIAQQFNRIGLVR